VGVITHALKPFPVRPTATQTYCSATKEVKSVTWLCRPSFSHRRPEASQKIVEAWVEVSRRNGRPNRLRPSWPNFWPLALALAAAAVIPFAVLLALFLTFYLPDPAAGALALAMAAVLILFIGRALARKMLELFQQNIEIHPGAFTARTPKEG
jgi:Flp pilus assembly protein TadB